MKLQEAVEIVENSLTDFDIAWAIEKTIAAAKYALIGDEPKEESIEHSRWEEKLEAYEELLDLASSMSDAVGEFDDAYTEFEEEYGKALEDFESEEFDDWFEAFEEDGPLEEQFCAQNIFADFKYAYEEFQDTYGGLENLEMLCET